MSPWTCKKVLDSWHRSNQKWVEKFYLRLWMANHHEPYRRTSALFQRYHSKKICYYGADLGGTFKLFTWNTRTLKALAHWLQKIFIMNSCTLIQSGKLSLYGCCFTKICCPVKPWQGVQFQSLLLEGIFSGEKKSWVSAASYNRF